MNIIEKQTELGKSLYEINTATLSEMATLTRNNIEKYFETNRTFGEKLPEVRDPSTFFNLQREYKALERETHELRRKNQVLETRVEQLTLEVTRKDELIAELRTRAAAAERSASPEPGGGDGA